MSILDELKKWTHPYDEDEDYDDEDGCAGCEAGAAPEQNASEE